MWFGSGFIPILVYAGISGSAISTDTAILTESNHDVLTESGSLILVE